MNDEIKHLEFGPMGYEEVKKVIIREIDLSLGMYSFLIEPKRIIREKEL